MSQKIVFTGITSFRNHGVEALIVSAIAQLQQRLNLLGKHRVVDEQIVRLIGL